jgi:hypothetical protein
MCQEEFKAIIQTSSSQFGLYLDFKPNGAIITPEPIPKCPKCGFVSYEGSFGDEEIEVLSDIFKVYNIFEKEPNMPDYYYFAREMELVYNSRAYTIADLYIKAVWQSQLYAQYNCCAYKAIKYIDLIDETHSVYSAFKLIKLDFLRRSGKFVKAKELISALQNDACFNKDHADILTLQRKLITRKLTNEYIMPPFG